MKKGNTFIRVWKEGETPPPMPTYQPCATLLKTIEPCAPPTNVVFRPATPCVPAPQTKVVRRPCFRRRAYACAGASYSGGVRSSGKMTSSCDSLRQLLTTISFLLNLICFNLTEFIYDQPRHVRLLAPRPLASALAARNFKSTCHVSRPQPVPLLTLEASSCRVTFPD